MSEIKEVVYPKGNFEKKFDQIILTGEVFRATLHPNQIKEDDKEKQKYAVSLKISPETFKELKSKKMLIGEAQKQGILTGLKKVELSKRDEDGNVIEDEMGDPVKEFSHYQISVYQNGFITKNGERQKVNLPVTMAEDGSVVDGFLQEGSRVSVLGQCYETTFRDKPAMGLNLREVKIHEAILYEGGSNGGGGEDPWAALGLSSSAAPKSSAQETKQEVKEAVAEPQTEAPISDDFDDTIPF